MIPAPVRPRQSFIYSGKAHRRDDQGKEIILRIHTNIKALREHIHIVFVEDYNMQIARLMVAGAA
jgi:starch phosphorylase